MVRADGTVLAADSRSGVRGRVRHVAPDGTVTPVVGGGPSYSLEYQVRYAGFSPRLGTYATTTVYVRTRVTAAHSTTSLRLGGSVTIRGSVAPSHRGQQVTVQRYSGGAWRTVGYATLSSTGTYAYTVRPSARGTYSYRVVKRADTDHAEGVSPTVRFSVL